MTTYCTAPHPTHLNVRLTPTNLSMPVPTPPPPTDLPRPIPVTTGDPAPRHTHILPTLTKKLQTYFGHMVAYNEPVHRSMMYSRAVLIGGTCATALYLGMRQMQGSGQGFALRWKDEPPHPPRGEKIRGRKWVEPDDGDTAVPVSPIANAQLKPVMQLGGQPPTLGGERAGGKVQSKYDSNVPRDYRERSSA